MAFMISDIGIALQDQGAEQEEVRQLNAAFADYRRSGAQCAESSAKLKDILQSLSDEYPELISKSADLQSRIDESVRALASNDQDPENPF
jgi:small-conductance mechanosensitive channel